ncbi:proteasome subunit alpha [Halovivax limisalsi]|uniref:proteasome subunit alpha n=1 Tax=Halovivax limisalsi TaxID=1453760 RepID=UPI001FFDEBF9|nr:proteasome subunit alpha [Halovivax limisalsi]
MSQTPAGDGQTEGRDPPKEFSTGTTIVGLAGADGVVLGADARASLGGRFVTNQSVRKVEPIGEHAAIAFSGGVSDAQSFVAQLRAEQRIYELDHDRPMSTGVLAERAAGLLRSGQFRGLGIVLGGVDPEPAIYEVDGAGGVLRDDVAAGGSGMQLAYGALEAAFESSSTVESLRLLAARALESAAERDVASGDGMTITAITADGLAERRIDGLGEVALDAASADGSADGGDADEGVTRDGR